MEIEVASPSSVSLNLREKAQTETEAEMERGKDPLRVKRKTLQAVLEQCQRALELISDEGVFGEDDEDDSKAKAKDVEEDGKQLGRVNSFASPADRETDELCNLLKSRVECADFLEKLECAQVSFPQSISEDCNSWDIVSANDVWESDDVYSDQEDYVLVHQEDIVEGIACFMAAYLLSLKQTKDFTPNQLQEALSKTFSVKKRKGKLRKAWDGSKVIYNVASWGATAIGIYQNPVILRVANNAFWTSCHVISKLL